MSRYIDADAFVADGKWCGLETAEQVLFALDHQPSIDIVRCKECKHWWRTTGTNYGDCNHFCLDTLADAYCSYGQKERASR